MRSKAINLYVGAVCGAALVLLATVDWPSLGSLPAHHRWGLAILILSGLVSESMVLPFRVARSKGQATMTFLPLLTGMVVFGTPGTVLFIATSGVVGEFVIRRKPLNRAIFNNAQWIVATVVGGWVFYAFAEPFVATSQFDFSDVVVPFVLFTLTFLTLNHTAVAVAISLSQRERFGKVLRTILGPAGTNFLNDVLVSPFALGIAYLYIVSGPAGLIASMLGIIFIRRSYLTRHELEQKNRDLLNAIVKAIETRDPYTSGHSLRVSSLARRIASELGLAARREENIANAALLHDVGKIDAVYTEILKKPDSLSPEERRVIESHVTKGVELLTSLSSFPPEVIAAVKHHHEREDGKGYPDGLRSREIPIGAKIIKVCDAIDAMLSDRPYRDALTLAQVREQLTTYAGTQFDAMIVECVVESTILEEHQQDVINDLAVQRFSTPVETEGGSFAQPIRKRPRIRRIAESR